MLRVRGLAAGQYSLGSRSVVTDRSASVKTHSLSVLQSGPTSYEDKIRAPFPMAAKFAARSSEHTVPKSPYVCRRRIVTAFSPCRSSRSSAPGVATTSPIENIGNLWRTEKGGDLESRVGRGDLGFMSEISSESSLEPIRIIAATHGRFGRTKATAVSR